MSLKLSKPWFIENSKIPVWLSVISPIDIGAITIGPFVLSREEISDTTRNHEIIHWQQYIDTAIVGFWFLYVFYWVWGFLKYRDGQLAYTRIPFEQEAYANEDHPYYLVIRKRWNWIKYKI